MIKEFKAFAMRGNLLELATAFILGLAFATLIAVPHLADKLAVHQAADIERQ